MPIRLRITLLGTGVVALAIVLLCLLVYSLVRLGGETRLDRPLAARLAALTAAYASGDALPPSAAPAAIPVDLASSVDPFVMLLDAAGQPRLSSATLGGEPLALPADLLAQATQGAAKATLMLPNAPGVRVQLAPLRSAGGLLGYVVVGQSLRRTDEDLRGLRGFLIVASVVTLLTATGAIWLVVERALRPLRLVAQASELIGSTGDLGQRLPARRGRDEVALLTASFNRMLAHLAKARDDLAAALAAQRRFVADASHELRTPLTTIRTNADFLLRHPTSVPADRDAALHDIAGETARMTRLVHDLLTLARADGGLRLERAPLDLAPLTEQVVRQARQRDPDRAITLDADASVPLCGHADALTQLLWVLVDNALAHTPTGTAVELWLATRKDLVLLHVSDEGTGISAADLPHIFDRFYQADASRRSEGAGLGLAIAHWIVGQHDGRIRAYGNDAGGATFRVELPAPSAAQAAPAGEPSPISLS